MRNVPSSLDDLPPQCGRSSALQIDWWPRLLVIEPFVRGDAAHYQRYDWPCETLADWHTIEPAPIVIIEGVSAGRSEWAAHLSYLIWIETPREERLRAGSNATAPQHSTTGNRGRPAKTLTTNVIPHASVPTS